MSLRKVLGMAAVVMGLAGQNALGCGTTVNGTTLECGNNWIRYKLGYDAFDIYKGFGSRGYVRRADIIPGCFVYGPYASIPRAGSLRAYMKLEALVDMATLPRHPAVLGGGILAPQANEVMFRIDISADVGQRILSQKIVRFSDMTTWTGQSHPYGRCTSADPCTAGSPGLATRTFRMYRNVVNLDLLGYEAQGPMNNLEIRVCDLNRWLTKMQVHESAIEFIY